MMLAPMAYGVALSKQVSAMAKGWVLPVWFSTPVQGPLCRKF